MLNWFDALMPKERGFFDLFDRHAATLAAGAEALRAMLDGGADVASAAARINTHEEEADQVVRDVALHIRRTFITPFDRSDILKLTKSLDDAIDQMQKIARTATVYGVREFEPPMREFGQIIQNAAVLTVEAVHLLRESRKNLPRLTAIAEELSALEGRADDLHVAGLQALFQQHGADNPMGFWVGEDLYDHLEKVMDRFEDVSDRISGIVIDHL